MVKNFGYIEFLIPYISADCTPAVSGQGEYQERTAPPHTVGKMTLATSHRNKVNCLPTPYLLSQVQGIWTSEPDDYATYGSNSLVLTNL